MAYGTVVEVHAAHFHRDPVYGLIGNCPVDHGPLFYGQSNIPGRRFALCRERHLFEVDHTPGERYGRLTRLKGVKSKDVRGW